VAKLKAPMLSFGARGAISKSVVFFPWKGIDAAREYVIPANPQTGAQKTQRGYLKDAVDEWHGANYSADDRTAWNRFAGILAEIMSGFNAYVRTFLNEARLGNVWTRMKNVVITAITASGCTIDVDAFHLGGSPTIRYGTSKTFMPNTQAMVGDGPDHWDADLAGLEADTLYYFTITYGTSGTNYTRVGIYQFRTLAA